MIEEEANAMDSFAAEENWPDQSESSDDIESLKLALNLSNKLVGKEVKRCAKYTNSIDVMFKKYRELGADSTASVS